MKDENFWKFSRVVWKCNFPFFLLRSFYKLLYFLVKILNVDAIIEVNSDLDRFYNLDTF